MEAKDIRNISDMQRFCEGCVNDYSENLCSKEELLNNLKDYTFKIINLTLDECSINKSKEESDFIK